MGKGEALQASSPASPGYVITRVSRSWQGRAPRAPLGPWLVLSKRSCCPSLCPTPGLGAGSRWVHLPPPPPGVQLEGLVGLRVEQPSGWADRSDWGSRGGGVSPQANKLAAKRKAHDTAVKEEKKKSKKARRA